MQLEFSGELWFWRGPAPWHFVSVPDRECDQLAAVAGRVSYGWGMVPVTSRIGGTTWATALWPKDGAYIVPIRIWVREAEDLQLGDEVTVQLSVDV